MPLQACAFAYHCKLFFRQQWDKQSRSSHSMPLQARPSQARQLLSPLREQPATWWLGPPNALQCEHSLVERTHISVPGASTNLPGGTDEDHVVSQPIIFIWAHLGDRNSQRFFDHLSFDGEPHWVGSVEIVNLFDFKSVSVHNHVLLHDYGTVSPNEDPFALVLDDHIWNFFVECRHWVCDWLSTLKWSAYHIFHLCRARNLLSGDQEGSCCHGAYSFSGSLGPLRASLRRRERRSWCLEPTAMHTQCMYIYTWKEACAQSCLCRPVPLQTNGAPLVFCEHDKANGPSCQQVSPISVAPNKVQEDSPHTASILSSTQNLLQCWAAVTSTGMCLHRHGLARHQR